MMEFLQGRYGNDFMTSLHRGDANGFAGLQEALDGSCGRGKGKQHGGRRRLPTCSTTGASWSPSTASSTTGARINGSTREKNVTAPTLDATINWDAPDAYSRPGRRPTARTTSA